MVLNCFSTATDLVRAIRTREISSLEVVELFLAQHDQHNAAINAICALDAESARSAAQAADAALARGESLGPLHGLPVSFKDSHATRGLRTACGLESLKDFIPDHDGFAVARIRAAGGIVYAKTNVPTLLGGFHTDNTLFGRTNNPWNPDCTPGGSSGGSGAALAAGMTPLDIGSDMLGSIRIPAHYCGVAGLKPTQFSVSPMGHYPPLPGAFSAGNILSTRGPLARCIDDLLLALPVIAGPDPADPDAIPISFMSSPELPPTSYRVAWTDDFGGMPVSADTRAALERTAAALQQAGLRVEKASPSALDFDRIWFAAGELYAGTISQGMSDEVRNGWLDTLRTTARDGALEAGCCRGAELSYKSWFNSIAVRQDLILQLRKFFEQYDGWLVPASCGPAVTHDNVDKPREINGASVAYMSAVASHVAPFNLSGSPAVTIPAALSSDGLPIGLQLVGRPWQDMQLLRLAQCIEQVIGRLPSAPAVSE